MSMLIRLYFYTNKNQQLNILREMSKSGTKKVGKSVTPTQNKVSQDEFLYLLVQDSYELNSERFSTQSTVKV